MCLHEFFMQRDHAAYGQQASPEAQVQAARCEVPGDAIPPDPVARNPAQLTARLRKWLHHSPRTSVSTTLPRECTLRVTPCEGGSQGWYGGPARP